MKILLGRKSDTAPNAKYPGERTATDGSGAVVAMETAASDAAGAYPITPSTQMGEGWAEAVAAGRLNVHGRKLLFFEPEGEHAAAAVTAGMAMVGLRSTNFSSGQGIAYMHESLYAAVGKRLTYVLNVAARAMTKHALNVHAGHDDYHAVDDTGFFQLFAKDVQEAADLNLIAHRIAELSLNPGLCAQDGFLTSHVIETVRLPERALIEEYLGDPADVIETPTPAQRLVFGERRRRIPEMYDFDDPAMLGVVQNQDSYAQGVAAQRPFFFDHVAALADRAMDEFFALTGRRYHRACGYRIDDADYVIAGQGSVVANSEALCDWLRRERRLRIGVLNVTMFRPFPADVIARLLRGKKAVVVLERVDQPLAVDPPLLREIRAAMGQAVENGRARGDVVPHKDVPPCRPDEVPDFFSGCFGLGSRDLQPSDLMAAVENMLPRGKGRRRFYLGIDFVRPNTRLPKLQIWQDKLLQGYPELEELALHSDESPDLMPEGSLSLRIHSVGGWGAITMGKNLALTAADLLGLYIKANPKYGSEKKGQPTTFYATLAPKPVRVNCELNRVHVVLSPDPNVFGHGNPLAGLCEGGVFVIQNDRSPEDLWRSFPGFARRLIRNKKLRVYHLDAFKIATEEASTAELRYRMQGTAFMGAFFRAAPWLENGELDEDALFQGVRAQFERKFGKLSSQILEDNLRVLRRGFDELRELDWSTLDGDEPEVGTVPHRPDALEGPRRQGLGDPGRFWEQVCHLYKTGEDPIADPFVAISAIPAATSTIRDMTDVRFEVPKFIAEKCTGCGQCWTQCPDAAIPGLVTPVEDVLRTVLRACERERPMDRLRQVIAPLAKETHRLLKSTPFHGVGPILADAYASLLKKLAPTPERRAAMDEEFGVLHARVSELPLAKTAPFFDVPESKEKGTGGLLSITVSPEACKGCNICVDVCPDQALVTVKQDEDELDLLRRNWDIWKRLPDTDDRYINVASLEEGIGVLPSLLLKKEAYRSMLGGDGACMGCGEKTALHLVLSAVNALMLPRVRKRIERLGELIEGLENKARSLLVAGTDLEQLGPFEDGRVDLSIAGDHAERLGRILRLIRDLKDLRWRYTEGPSGKGRARVGFANSTGCSSVWGSTYPYNPYPFPWVNHLFQDAPSIAVGLFEGHMRKMADGFVAERKAALELEDAYDPAEHDAFFEQFDWHQFSDEEFLLCPPIFAVGGDGAMLDIGFQNLSRVLASGKPIRIAVLDTQVYSNTGGQACTSGFLGQVSDMAQFGPDQHGKQEPRKELSLIAIAHRGAYVLQSSQAAPSHLLSGVLRGLQVRRPAVFVLHTPCPPEHGIADDAAARQARLALESRALPLLRFDPDAGDTLADCLDLDGNPAPDRTWPTYELRFTDEDGTERTLEVPMTVADWAATEARFRKHFRELPPETPDDELVPFAKYALMSEADRDGRTPFIHALSDGGRLRRLAVSEEIVRLAEDRLDLWSQLRQLAGLEVAEGVRNTIVSELEDEFDARVAKLQAEHEAKLAKLRAQYPAVVARRLVEGLWKASDQGKRTVAELMAEVLAAKDLPALEIPTDADVSPPPVAPADPATETGRTPAPEADSGEAPVAEAGGDGEDDGDDLLAMEPYIESARCTACNECTNLNNRMFAYNDKKQAYIKDPDAGTFRELVTAAERCPVSIIHPGTPRNPKEKDLARWIARAEPFN